MSLLPSEVTKAVGEQVGAQLSDDVAVCLAQNVEYRLRETIQVF
jgi:hypothetical protein